MQADRVTKFLLALIALALWLNVFTAWVRPVPASAQSSDSYLSQIASNTGAISVGICLNKKLC